MKKLVVVGGGVGGTIVANAVAKKFSEEEVQITLIANSPQHIYLPGLIPVALGRDKPESVSRKESTLISKKIHLEITPAKLIEPKENRVLADGNAYDYDYLVVATGSRLYPDEIPGYRAAAHHFYDVDSAVALHEVLENFKGGRIVVGVATVPYRCPPAPLEFVFMLDEYFTKKGMRDKVQLEYVYPINGVFPIRDVEPMLAKLLEEKGVAVRILFNTESVDPQARIVNSLEGESANYDLLVMVPPHRGSKLIEDSGMGDRGGWLPTDKNTLKAKGCDNIYAVGDATDIPISKAGSTAHYEAKVVADRLVGEIRGDGTALKEYDGHVFCFLETGFGKGITLDFNYSHPPKPHRPGTIAHWEKTFLNKLYWSTVPKARV